MSQDGTQVRAFGKLVQDSAFYRGTYDLHHLSFMIRQALGRKDLLLFDGNPDYIERIEISYELHRDQEIPRYDRKKGHYFIDGNAQERLIIDRKSGTLEHFHQLSKKMGHGHTQYLSSSNSCCHVFKPPESGHFFQSRRKSVRCNNKPAPDRYIHNPDYQRLCRNPRNPGNFW